MHGQQNLKENFVRINKVSVLSFSRADSPTAHCGLLGMGLKDIPFYMIFLCSVIKLNMLIFKNS